MLARLFNRGLSLCFHMRMTNRHKSVWEKTCHHSSLFTPLVIVRSVQYHFKILPSGQSGSLMSFFERLQIGQSWFEDYDLPDGTLCVLVSWQSDPAEYWDERPAWIFWGRKKKRKRSVKFLGLTVLPICHPLYWTRCAVSDCRHCIVIVELWEIMAKSSWNRSDSHLKDAIWWLHISMKCLLLCFMWIVIWLTDTEQGQTFTHFVWRPHEHQSDIQNP